VVGQLDERSIHQGVSTMRSGLGRVAERSMSAVGHLSRRMSEESAIAISTSPFRQDRAHAAAAASVLASVSSVTVDVLEIETGEGVGPCRAT
jgi:hypothetical protein